MDDNKKYISIHSLNQNIDLITQVDNLFISPKFVSELKSIKKNSVNSSKRIKEIKKKGTVKNG